LDDATGRLPHKVSLREVGRGRDEVSSLKLPT